MAQIKPFQAMRFTKKAGNIKDVVCPPYDIISEEERCALLERSENNIIRLELPREGDEPYRKAGETLKLWLDNGILAKDGKDSVYVYEEEFVFGARVARVHGIIALVKLEEFSKGIVLPHEETLSKAKKDRFELMSETYCNFSQIYSLYIDEEEKIKPSVDKILSKKPDIEFVDNAGITQRLWAESDKTVLDSIVKNFEDKQLFIADGHHRYETALNFRNKLREEGKIISMPDGEYVMMFLADIDDKGLLVLPTHRLVFDVEKSEEEVIAEVSNNFNVEKKSVQGIEQDLDGYNGRAYGFYTGKDYYYLLTMKSENATDNVEPDRSDAYRSLDVTGLHSLILEPVFGIDKENMALQKNLTYTRSLDEAINSVKNNKYKYSFILKSTRIRQIKDVALAGDKMPQKSTYFYPKLITGLVMNNFGN